MSLDMILSVQSHQKLIITFFLIQGPQNDSGFLQNYFHNFLDLVNILFDPQNCLDSFQLFQLLLLGKKVQAHDYSLHAYQIASHK